MLVYFAIITAHRRPARRHRAGSLTAISGSITAVANVGPGMGPVIGPSTNFASLPDSAKWILSFGMLLGRLEILTVAVLFFPRSGSNEPATRNRREKGSQWLPFSFHEVDETPPQSADSSRCSARSTRDSGRAW